MVSFEQFVATASPRLVRAARLLVGSAADAEDLTQEALIVMHQRWQRLRDQEAAHAYAHRTLVRLARRHRQRARFRHETPWSDQEGAALAAVEARPDAGDDLARALARLGPRQREAIVLRYYLDLSIEETAHVMRCSAGTVKSQTHRALGALREHLSSADHALPPEVGTR